ncbi:MAG: sigma-54-dependent Fis family transcriptional regulator [Nitrospirae bacterium]|nr:sigma-54-dependent Fis family transcriptional regulator [Nitrospirota bacterium]
MADTILLVDDEEGILQALSAILRDEGYRVAEAQGGAQAVKSVTKDPPSAVLLDIWMPDQDGLETLRQIRELAPDVPVIMMSGHGTIETAIKAIKLGAYDYIEKPLSLDKVLLLVQHAIETRRLSEENVRLRATITRRLALIGAGPAMTRLKAEIATAASSHSRVLISGENGTGKEVVARLIHAQSPRAEKPFVDVNCAAIPDTLIESELFGHERGAFTGATAMKRGRFEDADGGTLFLDEVGDMSLVTQAKVLRVLQEQRFTRVGGGKPIEVDVRVISASNKRLTEEIARGAFREDLYYRLNVIPLFVPPLRDRRGDIPELVSHFLHDIAAEQGLKPKAVHPDVLDAFMHYHWPGNVRELRNTVERLLIMVPGPVITPTDIPPFLDGVASPASASPRRAASFRKARTTFEREFITQSLKAHEWNVSKTAEALGLERSHLHRKIKLLAIELRPDASPQSG